MENRTQFQMYSRKKTLFFYNIPGKKYFGNISQSTFQLIKIFLFKRDCSKKIRIIWSW